MPLTQTCAAVALDHVRHPRAQMRGRGVAEQVGRAGTGRSMWPSAEISGWLIGAPSGKSGVAPESVPCAAHVRARRAAEDLAHHARALRRQRGRFLGGHARPRRQPEHRRAARALEARPPFAILDLGCGPGRDLARVPRARATRPSASTARRASSRWRARTPAARCCTRTSSRSTCRAARFDGVFANASLFHVPAQELPRVLGELRARAAARAACSSARTRTATNQEGWQRRALRRVPRSRDLARAT